MRVARLFFVLGCTAVAGCVSPPGEGSECNPACADPAICHQGTCRVACNVDAECASDEVCYDGLCSGRDGICGVVIECDRGRTCGDSTADPDEICDGDDVRGQTCQTLGYPGGTLACSAACDAFDLEPCSGSPTCGDDVAVGEETCDGTALRDETCATRGFASGVLACAPDCHAFDERGCVGGCGNDVVDSGEACDGTAGITSTCHELGFHSGSVACLGDCSAVDSSGCGTCGDGTRNGDEACDGIDVPSTCESFAFAGGVLACLPTCDDFDTTGCTTSLCGNGIIESPEVCDGAALGGQTCVARGFSGGVLACAGDCKAFDTSACSDCGDGNVDSGEVCDGSNVPETCASLGLGTGSLACASDCIGWVTSGCSAPPVCGDEVIGAGETCDGAALAGETCATRGFLGGTLACKATCNGFDTAGCSRCGNGAAEAGEACDGSDLAGTSCASQGFDGGVPVCTAACTVDVGPCTDCGDSAIEGGEECDGQNLGAASCLSLGFDGGTLACSAGCVRDLGPCTDCGDGVREGNESCDGSDLGGAVCPGGTTGTPTCTALCTVSTASCAAAPVCGNGVREGNETCDGQDLGGATCTAGTSGVPSCSNCALSYASCIPDVVCGNGIIEGAEQCDGPNVGAYNCFAQGFTGGFPACTGACTIDFTPCSLCGDGFPEGPDELCDGPSCGPGYTCAAGCQRCIPLGWQCDPFGFADGWCDCGCGAPDVDCRTNLVGDCVRCDLPGSQSLGGPCPSNIDPSANWTVEPWTCELWRFGPYDSTGYCDCGCGAIDPNCPWRDNGACQRWDDPGSCGFGGYTLDVFAWWHNGKCVWTCPPDWLGNNGRCDCGCGRYDYDCSSSDASACNFTACGSPHPFQNWRCQPESFNWTCSYGYGEGLWCDCGCGALDPDCYSPDVTWCSDYPPESCANNAILINPDNYRCSPFDWLCPSEWYGSRDGCNCGCGAPDPDCGGDTTSAACDSWDPCPWGPEAYANHLCHP